MITTEKFIEMNELSKIIKASDCRTAIKWCEDAGIPIIPVGKKNVTYRILVNNELDRILINQLQKSYPGNWENLYKHYTNDDQYSFTIDALLNINDSVKMISGAPPKSRFAQKFSKK